MSVKRLYFLLIGVLCLLFIGLVAGTYGANSLLTTQADKLTALKAKNQALAQEQLSLNSAKEDVKKYAGLEQIAQAIVPEDKDQAQTVLEIVNLAKQYGITLASITFPASTLGTSTISASTSSTSTTHAQVSAAQTEAEAAANSPNSPTNSLSQLQVSLTVPGVYDLPITVQGDTNHPITYNALIQFLNALEHNRRTAEISTINISPTSNPSLLTFTLVLNEYIKP